MITPERRGRTLFKVNQALDIGRIPWLFSQRTRTWQRSCRPSAKEKTLRTNEAFLIGDPQYLWFILSGQIELFVVQNHGG